MKEVIDKKSSCETHRCAKRAANGIVVGTGTQKTSL